MQSVHICMEYWHRYTSYGIPYGHLQCREWKRKGVIDVQSDESEEEEVMGEGIGE